MNRTIAAVYAISIRGDRPYTESEKDRLIDCIPALVDQVKRLDDLLSDPFIRGYVERFGVGNPEKP